MDNSKDRKRDPGVACADRERLLVLHAWEELDARERASVEDHTRQCPPCAASLERELRLRHTVSSSQLLADRLDPSGALLAQCRSELEEALDDAGHSRGRPGWLAALRPASWFFSGHPAWSAALMVLLGIAVGSVLPQWYRSRRPPADEKPDIRVFSAPRVSDRDLQTMGIAGFNWVPENGSGSPSIELHLTAEKPLVLQGSLDDLDVKRVLTYVVQNGQRFNPGLRLDSVDLLRTRSSDSDVRRALCAAARKDPNAGVRLRALEALRGSEQDDTVRQTLLDALLNDNNPGVRVEAINSLQGVLRAMAETGVASEDARLVNVLRDRMQRDPNNYIRLQCATAIRQLGNREVY